MSSMLTPSSATWQNRQCITLFSPIVWRCRRLNTLRHHFTIGCHTGRAAGRSLVMRRMLLNCRSTVPKSFVSFGSCRWMSGAMKMFSRYSHFFWHSSHSSRVSLSSRKDWLILSTSPRTPVLQARLVCLRGGRGGGYGVGWGQQGVQIGKKEECCKIGGEPERMDYARRHGKMLVVDPSFPCC